MKAIFRFGLFLALALLLGGCAIGNSPPTTPGLGLDPAPWKAGDRLAYNVIDDKTSAVTGTIDLSFSQEGDAWVISETDRIADAEQQLAMRVSSTALAPLGEMKTIRFATTTAALSTTYAAGKVAIDINVNGTPDSTSLTVPSNAIDSDQLLMTLRALPFAQGYTTKYVVIVPQNAQKVNLSVTVQAQENITVPAGSFATWPVELDFGQGKQTVWYQVDAPHNLVQYDDGINRLVLVKQ